MFISADPKIANEQIKLTATFLNAIAIAIMVIGVLTPAFVAPDRLDGTPLVPVLAVAASLVVHFSANRMLRIMRKDG